MFENIQVQIQPAFPVPVLVEISIPRQSLFRIQEVGICLPSFFTSDSTAFSNHWMASNSSPAFAQMLRPARLRP